MTTHVSVKPFSRSWSGWLGVVGILAGLWLIAAPFLFNFNGGSVIGTNAIITGAVIAVLSAVSAFGYGHMKDNIVRLCGWLTALAGLWAAVAAFVLNYQQGSTPFYALLITGVLSAIIAGYAAYKGPHG